MTSIRIILFSLLVFGGFGVLLAQMAALSSVPETIQSCYRNITAYDRYKRQPMRIENLVAIIRKLEEKTNYNWDIRRLARTIVKRYQFDGMEYHPERQVEFAYSQWPLEGFKSLIVHELIPAGDTFPEGALDNDERCALHWMMSHSLNATMRDDEYDRYGYYRGELRAKRSIDSEEFDESNEDVEEDLIHYGAEHIPKRVRRAVDKQKSNRPVETGVIYTKWGSISAGRLIAGIAAGLEPQEIPVVYVPSSSNNNPLTPNNNGGSFPVNPNTGNGNYNPNNQGGNYNPNTPGGNNNNNNPWPYQQGRKKRQAYGNLVFSNIKNLFAATLAGDIGQAAILNAPYKLENVQPPAGTWNDTVCPREYTLNALNNPNAEAYHATDTWSYMTAAEIRGGIDGLVLGSRIRTWDRGTTGAGLRLSQILDMYYSEDGVAGDTSYRSCERYQLLQGIPELSELREQARSFAYEFNKRLANKLGITDESTGAFQSVVDISYRKMTDYGSALASIDPPCNRRSIPVGGTTEIPENDKYVQLKTNVYAVLDHSVTSLDEMRQQQRFLAQLAYDIDVSPRGSRLGVVDGGSGNIMIKPNDTDNAAILACRIADLPQLIRNQDIVVALRAIKQELLRLKNLEQMQGYEKSGVSQATTILIFVQGKKLEENRRDEIRSILKDFNDNHGDVHVIFTSSKYNQADFDGFVWNEDGYDFIKIRGSMNLTDDTEVFAKEFAKKSQGQMAYPKCDHLRFNQDQEYAEPIDIWVDPGSIQYYIVSPDDFFASVDMRFRFTSEIGKVRVCASRDTKFPTILDENQQNNNNNNNDQNTIAQNGMKRLREGGVYCQTTSGIYEAPGGPRKDIEFEFVKPCKRKRIGCKPIYLSVTMTTTTQTSASQIDCSTYGCENPDQVKLTWSHYGMRCGGGAVGLLASTLGSIMTIILSLRYFYNSF